LGKYGYKGGAHGAFADQTPEKIGDTVGEDEGIGDVRGAEEQGVALVANVTENTAKDSDEGDDGGGF
jgi:hypothetical protein